MSFDGEIVNITIDGTGVASWEVPEDCWWGAFQAVGGDIGLRFDETGTTVWTIYDGGAALSLPLKTSGRATIFFLGDEGVEVQILLTTGLQS